MTLRQASYSTALALGAMLLAMGVQVGAQTFTPPPSAPPNSNAYAPLNTSGSGQTKVGGLVLNTGAATVGLSVPNGRIEIGTAPAGATVTSRVGLAVWGKQLRIVDGTEGAGKVLTSDANGLASWSTAGGGNGLCKGATGSELPAGYGCAMLPNGAKMQWGRNSYLGVQEFVFLSPFTNTNYSITITPENTTSENCVPSITSKATTNAKFSTDNACTQYWYNYIAVGY